MKLFHIADLHLGKKLLGESLLEEQADILQKIIEAVEEEKPDAILIAGDVYDKNVPSTDAVKLLDWFLKTLVEKKVEIYMISGNHDSAERLEFASALLEESHVYIVGSFQGKIEKRIREDQWGEVSIYLLPFIKPAHLRPYLAEGAATYEEAVKLALGTVTIDTEGRNIILAHQYVTHQGEKPRESDSEQLSLGGLDEVDSTCFDAFDYAALGHIHRPQKNGRVTVRYSGSPLKYSFSEVNHKKSITIVELEKKGQVFVRTYPLQPKMELAILEDTMQELLSAKYESYRQGYYLSIIVTDEEPIEAPLEKLRNHFPGLLEFKLDNTRTRQKTERTKQAEGLICQTPQSLFAEFYQQQNNVELSKKEEEIMQGLFETWGEEEN